MKYLGVTRLPRVGWSDALQSAIFSHAKRLLFIKMVCLCVTTSKHQHHRTLLQTCNEFNVYCIFQNYEKKSWFIIFYITDCLSRSGSGSTCLFHVMEVLLPEAAEGSNATSCSDKYSWSCRIWWEVESTGSEIKLSGFDKSNLGQKYIKILLMHFWCFTIFPLKFTHLDIINKSELDWRVNYCWRNTKMCRVVVLQDQVYSLNWVRRHWNLGERTCLLMHLLNS